MHESSHAITAASWKSVLINLVDSLRWPVAVVAVALIFREPLQALIDALAAAIGS